MKNNNDNLFEENEHESALLKAFTYIIELFEFILGAFIGVRWVFPFLTGVLGISTQAVEMSNYMVLYVIGFASWGIGEAVMSLITFIVLIILGLIAALFEDYQDRGPYEE